MHHRSNMCVIGQIIFCFSGWSFTSFDNNTTTKLLSALLCHLTIILLLQSRFLSPWFPYKFTRNIINSYRNVLVYRTKFQTKVNRGAHSQILIYVARSILSVSTSHCRLLITWSWWTATPRVMSRIKHWWVILGFYYLWWHCLEWFECQYPFLILEKIKERLILFSRPSPENMRTAVLNPEFHSRCQHREYQ